MLVLAALAAAVVADVSHLSRKPGQSPSSDVEASVLRSESDVKPDGYHYVYETSNGIAAQADGQLKAFDKLEALVSQGSWQYTAPDGTPLKTSYIADENGYQPQGEHLPTPHPIPEYIARAVEWVRAHPPKE